MAFSSGNYWRGAENKNARIEGPGIGVAWIEESGEQAFFLNGCGKRGPGFLGAADAVEGIQAMLQGAAIGKATSTGPAAQELDGVPSGRDDVFLALLDDHSDGGWKAFVTHVVLMLLLEIAALKRAGFKKVPTADSFWNLLVKACSET